MKTKYTYIFISLVLLLNSCAKIGSPNGGPKDSIAPVIAEAFPENKSLSFDQKKITIQFDEYIKLEKLNSQLIISPPIDKKPIIKPANTPSKKITIQFVEPLLENTTYTLNFGKSIVDNNEGNELGNFSYVFSTGKEIDTLSIKGNVLDPLNSEPSKNISLILYKSKSLDSIPDKPNYVANTLDESIFALENIQENDYQLIALEDLNNNYKYDQGLEKIGFIDSIISLKKPIIINDIILFKENKPTKYFNPTQSKANQIILAFNGEKPDVQIEGTPNENYLITQQKNRDSLIVWFKDLPNDTLNIKLSNKKDTIHKASVYKMRDIKKDSLIFEHENKPIFHPKDTLTFNTNFPISKIKKENIQLIDKDSLNVDFDIDFEKHKTSFKLFFTYRHNQNYQLKFEENTIEDVYKNNSKILNYNFKTLDNEEYGSILLTIDNKTQGNLIIHLADNKLNPIQSTTTNQKKEVLKFNNLEAKKYTFIIIKDSNNNQIFDNGNFKLKKTPEKVVLFNKILSLRSNSEIIENVVIE